MALDGTPSATFLANLTIPAVPTSVVIGGLVTDVAYSIRAAAWTQMGLGPASQPVVHKMNAVVTSMKTGHSVTSSSKRGEQLADVDHSDTDSGSDMHQVVQETWFILLLGGILLAILCLLVGALIVRRSLARKKALSTIGKADQVDDNVAGSVRGRDVFWSRGWSASSNGLKEAEVDAHATLLPQANSGSTLPSSSLMAPPEYAELLGQCNNQEQHPAHQSLSSFLPRRALINQHPAAYATTTLVTQRNNGTNTIHGFNNPYTTSGTAFSTSDSSGYTTDELGDRHRRGFPSVKTNRSRQAANNNIVKVMPNLGELFPPPPRHPPPSSPTASLADQLVQEVLYSFYIQIVPFSRALILSFCLSAFSVVFQANLRFTSPVETKRTVQPFFAIQRRSSENSRSPTVIATCKQLWFKRLPPFFRASASGR